MPSLGVIDVEEKPVLCDSIMSKPKAKWLSVMAVAFGVAFLSIAVKSFTTGESIGKVFYHLAIGAVCIYGASIERRLYISEEGIVREVRAWGRRVRRVLPWDDVKFVTLAFRKSQMMAFFEVDVTGWKVPFSSDQEGLVREILDDYIPDVEVKSIR